MSQDLSRLEGAILQAAVDPAAWTAAMAAFVETFPGARASLLGFDTQLERSLPATQAGYDDAFVADYYRHFHAINPYVPGWVRLPVGQIIHSTDLVPEEEILRTEFYRDWVRPQQDIRHTVGGVLARDPGRLFLFSLHIEHRAAERVTRPLMEATARLQGLLRHALDVNRMMLGHRLGAEALRHGVDPSDAAVLLLCDDGLVLHANRQADHLLGEGRLLRRDLFGRLRMAGEAEASRMDAALRHRPRGTLTFRAGTSETGHDVRVVPLRPESLADLRMPLLLDRSPAALVILRPSRCARDGTAHVMQALGLTRAEAEVAQALVEGATVAEVAELRGVSVQTVRNQVKSALGKTGSRRQADLVRAVSALRPA